MVITLEYCGTQKGTQDNEKLYFPVVPEQLKYKSATMFQEYDILNKGEAKIPNGNEITTIGWESFFPGENLHDLGFVKQGKSKKWKKRTFYEPIYKYRAEPVYHHYKTPVYDKYNRKIIDYKVVVVEAHKQVRYVAGHKAYTKNVAYYSDLTPKKIHNKLESWRSSGKKLKLNITDSPFSGIWVYIDSYEATMQDAHGSIYYSIEFSKAVDIAVTKTKTVKKTNKANSTKRTSKKATTKKHTIKKGDTLWAIAKKYYGKGSQWKKIYTANKAAIEKAAKKHGKKNSKNGHWIYPGTVLKIP